MNRLVLIERLNTAVRKLSSRRSLNQKHGLSNLITIAEDLRQLSIQEFIEPLDYDPISVSEDLKSLLLNKDDTNHLLSTKIHFDILIPLRNRTYGR